MSNIEDNLFLVQGLSRKSWSGEIVFTMYKGNLSERVKLNTVVNAALAVSTVGIIAEFVR